MDWFSMPFSWLPKVGLLVLNVIGLNLNVCAVCEPGENLWSTSEIPIDSLAWAYFPPDDTIACDEMMPTIEETMPVANDAEGTVEVEWVGDGPFDYPFGCAQSYTCPRVYRATNAEAQTLMDTIIITVLDTVAPTFIIPAEHELIVNGFEGQVVPVAEAFVQDDCDILNPFEDYEVLESSTDMGNGVLVISRTYTTSDACNNVATFHQTITFNQSLIGCTDEAACNFDPTSEEDDGSCEYPVMGFDCEGNCLLDEDNDGICDPEVEGCTNELACNYMPDATEDDGTCDFCSCPVEQLNSGYSLSLEIVVDHDEGSALAGMTTYRMYVNTPTSNDILSAIFGDDERPLIVSTTTSFYQDPAGGVLGSDVQPALFGFFPSLEFDSWVTIGLDGEAGPGEQPPSTIGQQTNAWESNFEDGLDLLMQDDIGGAIFLVNAGYTNALSGEEQRILIGQFTTDGEMSGRINVQMFLAGSSGVEEEILTFFFEGPGEFLEEGDIACGCTDETACNYDALATSNDASCLYTADPCDDENGLTMNDVITESCECIGEVVVEGCTDLGACNYNPSANLDDESCEFPESPCTECDGSCLEDNDGDGVCDCLEFPGCTDVVACNYDPIYTEEAGNCYYAEPFYDCEGNCLTDSDGDGVCNELEVLGCTDESFCNYNPQATEDNGSCGEEQQVNDLCTGALNLACGESFLMNNEECAAVDTLVQGCASVAPQGMTPGLWFTFEGTGNEVTVTTCLPGTNFDTYLSVYEGTCGDLTCVAGNDDQSEPAYDDLCLVDDPEDFVASTVTMNTSSETTYWVLVSGVTGESGDFEIGLTCVRPGCTDEAACNYDATANVDDGSCESTSCVGCTNPAASNYNPLATISDDDACQFCSLSLATTLVQGLTCAGDANAQVTIDITNVTHPDLLVYFLNGDTVGGTMFDSLSAGTYTALVTEGAGCSALVNFTVNDGISLNVIAETTDVSCHGEATGLIDATVSNGQLPYTFELFGNATDVSNTGLFDDLMGGEYTLEVADANGCTGSVELEIDEPLGLTLDANITNAEPPGTGAIDLTITGGTPPFTVSWSENGVFVSDSEDLEGLDGPSSFEVLVVDGSGCQIEGGPYAVSDASGLFGLESVVFSVMPNPAAEVMHLQWPIWLEHVELRIFDASGRAMFQQSVPGRSSWTMDVSAWAAGTYHVQLSASAGMGHASLVIQR